MMSNPEAALTKPECVVFRVDASLDIGTGHVMRCLTLADMLRKRLGAQCHFLCRPHAGNMIDHIEARGFHVRCLRQGNDMNPVSRSMDAALPEHAHWLKTDWRTDALESAEQIASLAPDWVIVDHYALDACWEELACPAETPLLVIDDLADRPHVANYLLDQNLGRRAEDYAELVPPDCRLLVGPEYALLRPEFNQWRRRSLERRRQQRSLERLLVTLGGVDKDNVTGTLLDMLGRVLLPESCKITVVMGASAPWKSEVSRLAEALKQPTEVVTNVSNMAERMAEADLVIGAAGSSAWERCCLGVPTLMLVIAENQRSIARALEQAGAATQLESLASGRLAEAINALQIPHARGRMIEAAAALTSGHGAELVARALLTQDVRNERSH